MSAVIQHTTPTPGMEHADAPLLAWSNSLHALGDAFYTRVAPTQMPDPYMVGYSTSSARLVSSEGSILKADQVLQALSGNAVWPGMDPIATVYSGHQFGVWAGQLGDGRALLLGDLATANGPLEVQIKGAGKTPYSRMGDGRAVLRSSIREFLCSEAMAGLGIPTTRALCVTGSDMPVMREEMETAAVVTRLAPSFIRFGHFEHFAFNGMHTELRQLADFVITRFYPECRDSAQPYTALLQAVTLRTADLLAQWQAVGFCHGVMNTDNMSILGLTLDYGPFGFLDTFDPGHICNHSDHQGRYAYGRQPNIAFWNLYCLGQALMPLIESTDDALAALEPYKARYPAQLNAQFAAKLGLRQYEEGDQALFQRLFEVMAQSRVDFTLFFRKLALLQLEAAQPQQSDAPIRDLFLHREAFDAWAVDYRARLARDARPHAERALAMNAVNPKYVLRNYLAEQAIRKAREKDFSEVARLLACLENPFDEQPEYESYAGFPPDWAMQLEVSCSS
jgi:uncharacterized protein YdiU (UPF0061 family)